MTRAGKTCAVFVAKFIDGYRVIYRMNDEWLLDSPEASLTAARLNAERCIEVMKSKSKCIDGSARIYEVNIAANLCDTMRSGLRDKRSPWQQHMNHVAQILNVKEHVSMASFVTDRDSRQPEAADDPYLFVVSDNLSTGQHYIDTIHLCEQTTSTGVGVVHEISQGKPRLHINERKTESGFLRFVSSRKEDHVLSGITVGHV